MYRRFNYFVIIFPLISFILVAGLQRGSLFYDTPLKPLLNTNRSLDEVEMHQWESEEATKIWYTYSLEKAASITDLESPILEKNFIPQLNISLLKLKNGLKVCLKPTDFESDEIMIKLAAKGGYGSLSIADRPSGELSAQISWESGMGGLTSDQVSVLLYEHSLDFCVKIKPYSREIEGTATKDGLPAFFESMKTVFVYPHFKEEAKEAALNLASNAIQKDLYDYEKAYEAVYAEVNAPGISTLKPLTVHDLKNVDLEKAKEFFRYSFSDPSEFTCVIVGSFQIEALEDIIQILASIPINNAKKGFTPPENAPFPPGVTNKVISLKGYNDCLTRITFPLQIDINENNIHTVEFICQIIEARMRNILISKTQYSYGVDVSYEFPLYPYLVNPWISIRYRTSEQNVNQLKQLILSEIGILQSNGASENEIETIKRFQSNSDEYWLRDNFYWVSVLANYGLWDWNPEQIFSRKLELEQMPLSKINSTLKNILILGNYSVVTAKPAKS